MRPTRLLPLLPMLVFSWWLSCGPAPVAVTMPDPTTRSISQRIKVVEDTLQVISTRAFCPEELQSLLLRIYQDCNLFTCKTQQVTAMVTMADPKQRFMRLMKDVPHVVIYSTREQPISPQRLIQLQWLLAPPWPDFARVLIIARSGPNENTVEVDKRGRMVRKAISDMHFVRIEDFQRKSAESVGYRIPDKMLILPIQYDFPLNLTLKVDNKRDSDIAKTMRYLSEDINNAIKLEKSVILDRDKPLLDEPQDAVERGVWVFLLNCLVAADVYRRDAASPATAPH